MKLRQACAVTTLAGLVVALQAAPSLAQRPGKPFQSPLKNFTVTVPESPFGTTVTKRNSKDEGTVSFILGTGDASRIDYMRLPRGGPLLTGDEQQAGYERMLKGLAESNPGSAIVVQKPYMLDDISMLFAIVSFPGGSHLMEQATRKHFDSTRGLLFFVRSGFVYVLHDELVASVFDLGKEPKLVSSEELTTRAERSLPELYRSITFR